jgi:hypothetical protein
MYTLELMYESKKTKLNQWKLTNRNLRVLKKNSIVIIPPAIIVDFVFILFFLHKYQHFFKHSYMCLICIVISGRVTGKIKGGYSIDTPYIKGTDSKGRCSVIQ